MSSEDCVETHSDFDYHDCDTVTFSSSDNVLFNLHRTNLRITAGIFPGPEFDDSGEVIPLQESGDVLSAVFQFVYPERHPKLQMSFEFDFIAEVAEAAEKYQIFTAIDACEARFE
ncbi:hypothetical protein JR316_0007900 [Psilocybe cubensis]|uniref:BTB domain-containing protein n=2 Tax=Psilocybe cubensis TaxID=181762 RepID=A0A8H8CIK7_PSICU|nr:hypothetical protein JR316_0007900 [Psilocybe cubensis]KAH9479311.1 hypothetical protein JR316_0007900 [Psilocybe cubensis]